MRMLATLGNMPARWKRSEFDCPSWFIVQTYDLRSVGCKAKIADGKTSNLTFVFSPNMDPTFGKCFFVSFQSSSCFDIPVG